jgi:hypothetical protein
VRDIAVLEERDHPLAEFFENLRETRREMRAPPGTKQRCALQTMVRDEAFFLPIFLRYYSRFFGPEDIYVLDHGTTDGSTDVGGFVRIPVERKKVDNAWILERLKSHQRSLLESYDVVLTVDADEIVAPDPAWGTLGEYLEGFQEEWVNCLGYEILHLPDREPPLDPSRPVLEQRGYWFAADGYDKPSLATAPTPWAVGFHGREDRELNIDPDLRLIHLHRIDHEQCRRRHRRSSEWSWARRDVKGGWGRHNRITDEAEFEEWYYEGSCFLDGREVVLEQIPERWKGLF